MLPILESTATQLRIGGGNISKKAKLHGSNTSAATLLGKGRTLPQSEEARVQQLIRSHFPDQLGIDSALWTRRAVQDLIMQTAGVKMPIRTVGEYLNRWSFSPQKPLRRAYEQDPKLVEAWLKSEYPQIEQRAKEMGAQIAWGDESFSAL